MKSNNASFFLVPGFKMQIGDASFSWLVDFLKKKGFNVISAPVHWNNRTLSKNTAEFIEFFNAHKGKRNYVLGFSYGSVIALLSANALKPQKIFLCSLSSDFSEDRESMDSSIRKYIGKRRFADTLTRSGRALARELRVPSVIFYGETEGGLYPALKRRCEDTARLAKDSTLVVVKGAPHKIDFPSYVEAIKRELSVLRP